MKLFPVFDFSSLSRTFHMYELCTFYLACRFKYILNDNITYTAIKNLDKIKETYNPPILIIGNRTNQVKSTFNLNIECEKPIVKTFCITVIIQLLALEIALRLKQNIDKPHGLNKVVK